MKYTGEESAMVAKKSGKGAGRLDRLAKRAAGPALDLCPPGQIGGTYKPLTEAELRRIFGTALDLLGNYKPAYLTAERDLEIRVQFNILQG